MRISLAVAAIFLVGVQTLPAVAGDAGRASAALSCAVLAGQTALPTDVCRHLAAAFLAPVARIDFAALLPPNPAGPLPEQRSLTAANTPMAPGTSLKTNAAWQTHLDKGVANYHRIFAGQGLTYALPAAPSVLWPGGNPFAPHTTD